MYPGIWGLTNDHRFNGSRLTFGSNLHCLTFHKWFQPSGHFKLFNISQMKSSQVSGQFQYLEISFKDSKALIISDCLTVSLTPHPIPHTLFIVIGFEQWWKVKSDPYKLRPSQLADPPLWSVLNDCLLHYHKMHQLSLKSRPPEIFCFLIDCKQFCDFAGKTKTLKRVSVIEVETQLTKLGWNDALNISCWDVTTDCWPALPYSAVLANVDPRDINCGGPTHSHPQPPHCTPCNISQLHLPHPSPPKIWKVTHSLHHHKISPKWPSLISLSWNSRL